MASAMNCRFCGVPIDAQTAAAANAAQQRLNTAISQANAIKYTAWAAIVVVGAMLLGSLGYLSDRRSVIVWFGPLLAVAGTWYWFRQFGGLQTADPEYAAARRDVRRTGYVWGAAVVVEVILLAYVLLQ